MNGIAPLLGVLLVALSAIEISAYEIPANVQAFADRIRNGQCTGGKILKKGFFSETPDDKSEYIGRASPNDISLTSYQPSHTARMTPPE